MVFVLDSNKKQQRPIHPGFARKLLTQKKAAVFLHFPFTIILKIEEKQKETKLRVKIDPGSETTGIAIVDDTNGDVLFAAEIKHRGKRIKKSMDSRRALRRGKRNRKTRYRQPRFLNRKRNEDWLPPSLLSRVENIKTWVRKLTKFCPVYAISIEVNKFDTQLMENPEISGIEYQQGTLAGYEVMQYLLEKWGYKCAYCGKKEVKLQKEHIVPRSRGGTDRVSNLTISCQPCNENKNTKTAEEFGYPEVQKQAKQTLKDAAVMNQLRYRIAKELEIFGLPIEKGSGGLTKFNRTSRGLPKEHWVDAACVGISTPEKLNVKCNSVLKIEAMGHGNRQRCRTDKFGFPKVYFTGKKRYMKFQTGDIAKGKSLIGRVTIRQRPMFLFGKKDMHPKYLQLIQQSDGYDYNNK